MALKSVVHARANQTDAEHLYRRSKLTMALKNSFKLPHARTAVIATVSPASKDTEHSLNTLRHACVMDGQGNRHPNPNCTFTFAFAFAFTFALAPIRTLTLFLIHMNV